MMKGKKGIAALLLCLCLFCVTLGAQAASTSDAVEPIDPESECSLSISYLYGETAFSNVSVKLYGIAAISADYKYTLTPALGTFGLTLNGIQTSGEWDVIRSTLEAYITSRSIEPDAVAQTNDEGVVSFEELECGLYLAVADQASSGEIHCRFESSLVTLPILEQDGSWQYQARVNAKAEQITDDGEKEFKLLKLWRGDEGSDSRPNSVEVEIFRDGVVYETVILSEKENWSYVWKAKDDGSDWTVAELDVPSGYTMTVEERDNSLVITNTYVHPDDPSKPPNTGDTSSIMLYVVLFALSGTALLILGIVGRRKADER